MAQSVSREIIGPELKLPEAGWSSELAALARRYELGEATLSRLRRLVEFFSEDPGAPTTVREGWEVVRRHVADSLVALELDVMHDGLDVADLGSGGGIPGVILASALPSSRFALVEARSDKCGFLARLVAKLEMTNARVVCARAEEWEEGLGANDLVVARALAAQPVVMEYAAPLLRLGGHLVEWRGRRDAAEERAAMEAAAELGLMSVEVRHVEPFAGAMEAHLHVFTKLEPTPERYPRRAGVASKRPLGR